MCEPFKALPVTNTFLPPRSKENSRNEIATGCIFVIDVIYPCRGADPSGEQIPEKPELRRARTAVFNHDKALNETMNLLRVPIDGLNNWLQNCLCRTWQGSHQKPLQELR